MWNKKQITAMIRAIMVLGVMLLMVSGYAVKTLNQMPVNTKVTDGVNTWVIITAGTNVYMTRESSIGEFAYDAPEPTSRTVAYQTNGNPTWSYSNLYQYLNATGANWYVKKHSYDAPPSYSIYSGYKSTLGTKFVATLATAIQIPNAWGQLPWNGTTDDLTGCTGSTLCQLVRGYTTTTQPAELTNEISLGWVAAGRGVSGGWRRIDGKPTDYSNPPPEGYEWGGSSEHFEDNWYAGHTVSDYGREEFETEVIPYTQTVYHYNTVPVWTSAGRTLDINAGVVRTNTVTDYCTPRQVHPLVCVVGSKLYISDTPTDGVYEMNYNKLPTIPTQLTMVGDTKVPGAECSLIALGVSDPEGDAFVYSFEIYDDVKMSWEKIGESADGTLLYIVPEHCDSFYKIRVCGREINGGPGDYLEGETVIPEVDEKPTIPTNVTVSTQRAGMRASVTCSESTDAQGDAIVYVWRIEVPGIESDEIIKTDIPKMHYVVPNEGAQYEVHVKAVDAKGSASDEATTGLLTIKYNTAPTKPTFVLTEGRRAGAEGLATTSKCIDPNGDNITYYWEYSVAGGAWEEIDGTSEKLLTYTIPTGASYRIRVRAVDEYGAAGEYAVSEPLFIITSAYPLPPKYNKGNDWSNDPELVISPTDAEDTNYTGIYYSIKKLS